VTKRLGTNLLNLPVHDEDTWIPLNINFSNNREGGKYNICDLRIKSHTDCSAFPMTVQIETTDEQVYDFQQEVSAITITIEGGCELVNLLDAFQQILEAEKLINTVDKGDIYGS
jgi:hypothetical protein